MWTPIILYTMERSEIIKLAFKRLRESGLAKSQREFAKLLDLNEATISKAMKGEEGYTSDIMMSRINALMVEKFGGVPDWDEIPKQDKSQDSGNGLLVIPTEAMAGTLGEFADSVQAYECERLTSPIKGADFAIKVCGDSMSPDIPNGSQILIKRIYEEDFLEWGKIFCLDTRNGAIIKRVYPTDDPDVVECKSINPEYPPFLVNKLNINGWYRVLMVMSMK